MKIVCPLIIPVSLLVLTFGCASSSYAGLARRGALPAELEIAATTTRVPETVVTEIKNNVGQRVATEETVVGYRDVISGFSLKYAGKQVDEQDFYELAADRDGVDAVERARARGKVMHRAGLFLLAAGSAAAIAVPIAVGSKAAPYAVGQWFLTFPVGLALTVFGARPFSEKVLPARRAFGAIGHEVPEWAEQM
ncbi:MAG: hypothetical protein SFX73_09210 [Kofleriaceae bacterium]|nr:hypothetical protein [Kofleriaceae bacterium]